MPEIEVTPCPKCEGRRTAVNTTPWMGLIQPKKKAGGVIGGTKNVSLIQAIVCINCGYAELYAAEPDKLIPD